MNKKSRTQKLKFSINQVTKNAILSLVFSDAVRCEFDLIVAVTNESRVDEHSIGLKTDSAEQFLNEAYAIGQKFLQCWDQTI